MSVGAVSRRVVQDLLEWPRLSSRSCTTVWTPRATECSLRWGPGYPCIVNRRATASCTAPSPISAPIARFLPRSSGPGSGRPSTMFRCAALARRPRRVQPPHRKPLQRGLRRGTVCYPVPCPCVRTPWLGASAAHRISASCAASSSPRVDALAADRADLVRRVADEHHRPGRHPRHAAPRRAKHGGCDCRFVTTACPVRRAMVAGLFHAACPGAARPRTQAPRGSRPRRLLGAGNPEVRRHVGGARHPAPQPTRQRERLDDALRVQEERGGGSEVRGVRVVGHHVAVRVGLAAERQAQRLPRS